jgi:translation initiation factor IF-2
MAMRVYELAKKLGMENRVLIPELKKMGASVSSHSSTLDDEIVQKVLDKLGSKSKSQGTGIEGEPGAKSAEQPSHGKTMAAVRSQVLEEPPKPDKRRILIKRKKEDEPAEVSAPAPIVEGERSAQPASSISVPPSAEHAGSGGLTYRPHRGHSLRSRTRYRPSRVSRLLLRPGCRLPSL